MAVRACVLAPGVILVAFGCGEDNDSIGRTSAGGASASAGSGGVSVGGSGGESTSGSGGMSGASAVSCPTGLPGPELVPIPAGAGSGYCMDATEVTNAHYAAFIADAGSAAGVQDAWCDWNISNLPLYGWPAVGKNEHPVAYVHWCNAYAYCAWAGKRLCGRIGGGPNATVDAADATKSQWYNACSRGGALAYPYGDAYDPNACNGQENGVDATTTVGSKPKCEGGHPGLFDLSGNVFEWEDSCYIKNGNSGDACWLRGGGFTHPQAQSTCEGSYLLPRGSSELGYIGFRCCAESV